jgi:5-methylcytosine-specific restriction protein B
MTGTDLHQLWSDFLAAWPPERVRQMSLEEYTNPNKDDAFIYWLESRLDKLGSIWGRSAFKFGIYCRDNTAAKEASGGRTWGEKYAWLAKYGGTPQEAFVAIRSRLIEVLDAAQEGNFARVDEVDLAPVLSSGFVSSWARTRWRG